MRPPLSSRGGARDRDRESRVARVELDKSEPSAGVQVVSVSLTAAQPGGRPNSAGPLTAKVPPLQLQKVSALTPAEIPAPPAPPPSLLHGVAGGAPPAAAAATDVSPPPSDRRYRSVGGYAALYLERAPQLSAPRILPVRRLRRTCCRRLRGAASPTTALSGTLPCPQRNWPFRTCSTHGSPTSRASAVTGVDVFTRLSDRTAFTGIHRAAIEQQQQQQQSFPGGSDGAAAIVQPVATHAVVSATAAPNVSAPIQPQAVVTEQPLITPRGSRSGDVFARLASAGPAASRTRPPTAGRGAGRTDDAQATIPSAAGGMTAGQSAFASAPAVPVMPAAVVVGADALPEPPKELQTLRGHEGHVVALTTIDDVLASAGQDRVVRLWDLEQGVELKQLGGHNGPVRALASVSGLIVSSSRGIKLWDARSSTCVRTISCTSDVTALAARDGLLYSGHDDGTIRVTFISEHRNFFVHVVLDMVRGHR